MPERTPDDVLFYRWEPPEREVRPIPDGLLAIRCTRLAYDGPVPTPATVWPDRAVIDLVYQDHVEPLEQRYVYHSPTGMEFGFAGSGPADLALNILALLVSPKEAMRLHQDFKRAFVAPLSHDDGGEIRMTEVRAWIAARYAEEGADAALMRSERSQALDAEAIRLAGEWDALEERGEREGITPALTAAMERVRERLREVDAEARRLDAAGGEEYG